VFLGDVRLNAGRNIGQIRAGSNNATLFHQRSEMLALGPDMAVGMTKRTTSILRKIVMRLFPGTVRAISFRAGTRLCSNWIEADARKVQRLVRTLAETVEPWGKFYVEYHLPA
jgi:hypothetical protein